MTTRTKRMKPWPPDNEQLYYGDLVEPVRKIIKQAFKVAPKKFKHLKYDGYNIGEREQVCSSPPDEQFGAELIRYHKEHGRDVLDIALMVCFQLGVEQGRRGEVKETEFWKRIAEARLKTCR